MQEERNHMKKFFIYLSALLLSVSSQALDMKEVIGKMKDLEPQMRKEGLNDEQIKDLQKQALATIMLQESFMLKNIKPDCKEDIQRFCKTGDVIECLKKNRPNVQNKCETILRRELGGMPIEEATLYKGLKIPKGSHYSYASNGKIIGVHLSKATTYKNLEIAKGHVRFHNNGGGIADLKLAKDQYIDGIKYKHDHIGPFFDEKGLVKQGTLAENTEINGHLFAKGSNIKFDENRIIQSGKFAEDGIYKAMSYKAGDNLFTHYNKGFSISRLLKSPEVYKSIPLKTGDYLERHSSGRFEIDFKADTMTLEDRSYSKHSRLMFHANGQLQSGLLAEPTNIEGKTYDRGWSVDFDEQGKLTEAEDTSFLMPDVDTSLNCDTIDGTKVLSGLCIEANRIGQCTYYDTASEFRSLEVLALAVGNIPYFIKTPDVPMSKVVNCDTFKTSKEYFLRPAKPLMYSELTRGEKVPVPLTHKEFYQTKGTLRFDFNGKYFSRNPSEKKKKDAKKDLKYSVDFIMENTKGKIVDMPEDGASVVIENITLKDLFFIAQQRFAGDAFYWYHPDNNHMLRVKR